MHFRRRVVVACVAGWVFLSRIPAQAASSQDVTVLLFRTEAVQHVQIKSQAAVRLCARCAPQHGLMLLDLQAQNGAMQDASGKVLREVRVDGLAEVTTGGGHRAIAAGHWLFSAEQSGLRVSVTIPRERYVEAVLAGETSPQEPVESLKAMAVVARSFAAAAAPRHEHGALCDTTHCQMLRLERVPDAIREAVWNTSGETLWWKSKRVPGYFSQHCGGFTEDAAMAWGGPALPWLNAHADAWCARVSSQWRVSLTEAEVRRALAGEGFAMHGPIREVSVIARDRSGRARQLRIVDAASARTIPAANFRFALNRSFGWNQLRSERYQVRQVGDHIVFEGNAHGHGVGLCQAGAAEMARAGKSYHEVLGGYFPTTETRVSQSDRGWIVVPENGFTLRTTARDAELESTAARAFTEARTRWGTAVCKAISVTIFPSTELFRQATGQSGWNLARTQSTRIAMQPIAVLRTHGTLEGTLRHEFLHSFVEAKASPTAPLWLREGLVKALNGESCFANSVPSAEWINATLRNANNSREDKRAHMAACAMVKRLIAERGMDSVRALLENREQPL